MMMKGLLKLSKTIGFKLSAWYAGIFVLSVILSFLVAYLLLHTELSRQDHEEITSELKEISALYHSGGLATVARELKAVRKFGRRPPFFVRIADARNRTLLLELPYQWTEFDLIKLLKGHPREGAWVRLPSLHGGAVLEIRSMPLGNALWLQVGKSTEQRDRVLERFRIVSFSVMIPVVLLGLGCGAFLAFRALHPIRSINRTIRSIQEGRMSERVPRPMTGDDLDELIQLFNGMLERIEGLIEAMRESLDHVAHDLRTPMTRLLGRAEMALRSGAQSGQCREALAKCVEECQRILGMLNTLMDISEAEVGTLRLEKGPVDLKALVEELVEVYQYVADEKEVEIRTHLSGPLVVDADRNRIGQAVANILDNAVKYTPKGGRVDVICERLEGEVLISVADTGDGIPEDELHRIWERLYRGALGRLHQGLGLGLSLVRAIVNAHGGRVEVRSVQGSGSTFVIHLPTSPAGKRGAHSMGERQRGGT